MCKHQKENNIQAILLPNFKEPITDQAIIQTTALEATEAIWIPPDLGSVVLVICYPSISTTSNIALKLVESSANYVIALNPISLQLFQLGDFDGDTVTLNCLETPFDQYIAEQTSSCVNYIYSSTNGSFQLMLPNNNVFGLFILTRFFEKDPLSMSQAYFLACGHDKIMTCLDNYFHADQKSISGRQFFQFIVGKQFRKKRKSERKSLLTLFDS